MIKRSNLSKSEIASIQSLQYRVTSLINRINERGDVMLGIEPYGSVCKSLHCAAAALETILREY